MPAGQVQKCHANVAGLRCFGRRLRLETEKPVREYGRLANSSQSLPTTIEFGGFLNIWAKTGLMLGVAMFGKMTIQSAIQGAFSTSDG